MQVSSLFDNSRQNSKVYTKKGLIHIINALPLAIAVINEKRQVILANRMTDNLVNKNDKQLIGKVGGEALGCSHYDDVPEGCGFGPACLRCKLRQTVTDTIRHRKAHRLVEATMVFKKYGERYLRVSTLPMAMDDEQAVLLAIEDITELRKYEKTELEKEKLAAVIKTAGAACHEISQPLMVVLGMADLLLDDFDGCKLKREKLVELKQQADRLGEITRKLTTITKYETKPYLNGEIIDIDASSQKTEFRS